MRPLMPPVQTPDNLFHDGNPLTGELGTIVDAEHLNNVQGAVRDAQSELITVLNAAGINVDPSKQNQLLTALKALLLSRSNPFGDIKSDGTVKTALENLHLEETVNKAAGAIQKSGDSMVGPLGLTQTSSFGVATENTLGGNSIAIGDSDSGFKSNGDGNIALMANSVLAGYFSENELQHHEKVLTKIFRAISTGNATEGAGGFGSQLTSGAPFYSPAIVRQNNDNNYFPLWKQIVSLQSGYPVAASMGL
ncbi:TPA: hypothetical protein ACXPDA_005004, partial [Enterobacter hormaechei]